MEQRFYKVRLINGRVVGPLDLDRIKLFIFKGKITGLEMARLYPTGDWKDVNTYPEIADLLMQKLENKLTLDERLLAAAEEVGGENDGHTKAAGNDGIPIDQIPHPPLDVNTATPALQMVEGSLDRGGGTAAAPADVTENEATMVMTSDDERTMMVAGPRVLEQKGLALSGAVSVAVEAEAEDEIKANPEISQEPTAMLVRPELAGVGGGGTGRGKGGIAGNKKKIIAGFMIVCTALYLLSDEDNGPKTSPDTPIKIEIPAVRSKQDPIKSEAIFKKGLPVYYQDTVEGYKRAAEIFKDAASYDSNNVRALCLLASSYMNLIDVVERNEIYFNVVTRLIEMERAKGVDLAETVIADVELYLILGNPDAAFNRIVEFAKSHEWGMDMIYYLALSFYLKGQYAEALQQLNKIDQSNFFSPKISYLYGLIFEKNAQPDDAIKAFLFTTVKSPKHIKARIKLAELYFSKDNMPDSGKHADFVISHKNMASRTELAKAYYYRARMHLVASRELDALKDLEVAREKSPDDQDILLDYYTLKAKQGAKVKDVSGLAKMFYFMALGEKALKEEKIDEALGQFLSAREANDKDPTPLIRIADVFTRKGDLQSAIVNLTKAVALLPARKDIYPRYIRTLIQGYEFEDATKAMKKFQEQSPDTAILDRLNGELFYKQDKFQEANLYLKRAMNASNSDSNIYTTYGSLMFKTQNYREAAFYMGLALRFDPFNIEATVTIGKALSQLDSLDKGVEYVQTVLQMSPHKAALLNGIAEIYALKGKYDEALKFADNALTTDPGFALARRTKGEAYASQANKRKEALEEFTSYSNLAPLDPTGHIEKHKIFLTRDEKGRTDMAGAKAELLKVSSQYPRYPGIHFMLGDLFFQAGDMDKALFEAQTEVKSNPSFIPGYILVGTVYNKAKDFQNALLAANVILKGAPNYPPALLIAGIANRGLKSYAAAQSMIERASGLDPGNPAIWKELGTLYYDLNQYEKMKGAFKKYLELYPDAPDKGEVEDYLKKIGG